VRPWNNVVSLRTFLTATVAYYSTYTIVVLLFYYSNGNGYPPDSRFVPLLYNRGCADTVRHWH